MSPYSLFVLFVLLAFCGVISPLPVQQPANGCFRAAILDQVHQTDETHEKTVEANLELYDRTVQLAKQNGADIVVFPEEGILFDGGREGALKYGEVLPDQKTQVCTEQFASSHPVLHRLACLAKAHQIYVAGDVLDVQSCLNTSTVKCPADNKWVFNTAILIDREGNFRAKYHKTHLFGELEKNVPVTSDLVVVDTEIGRLGLQVCFDMIYQSPGHLMASKHMIDTLVFPTWWFDETPFLTASQFQMAWAFAHGVNVLAADIHQPPSGVKGSGIYAGSRQQFEVVDNIDAATRLLIASLPISPSSDAHCPMNATTLEMAQTHPAMDPKQPVTYFHLSMDLNDTHLMKLEPNGSHALNSYEGVVCSLDYQMDVSSLSEDDEFYLIASNRTKPGPFPWAEEFCGLIHCPTKLDACTAIQSDEPLQSKFHFAELYGQFGPNTTVFPSLIGSQHKVMQKESLWSYGKVGFSTSTKSKFILTVGKRDDAKSYPIGTIGLYGRAYERDPPFVQRSTGLFD